MPVAIAMQFFAVAKESDSSFNLQKIDIEASLQQKLSEVFLAQGAELLDPKVKRVSFHASYTPSADGISFIKPFEIPAHLKRGMDHPQEFDKIKVTLDSGESTIKAILAIDNGSVSGVKGYYFQHFDKSHVLKKGRTVLLRGGMFHDMVEPGIKISDRLTAVLIEDSLLFRSYGRTSQFIDLASYYREATDADITKILEHNKIYKTDSEQIISMCTASMRKRFSVIAFTKILENPKATPDKIQQGVRRFFNFKIDIKIDQITAERRIVFPVDQVEAGRVLEYLTESVYESDLTGVFWSSNSHRPFPS